MISSAIKKVNAASMAKVGTTAPQVGIGDSVRVFIKIKEGDKERVQAFAGTVIARDGGGLTETFTVRHVAYGVGVEKVFPLYSPSIEKVVVERKCKVRRAKLYFLRGRSGKSARLREVR